MSCVRPHRSAPLFTVFTHSSSYDDRPGHPVLLGFTDQVDVMLRLPGFVGARFATSSRFIGALYAAFS